MEGGFDRLEKAMDGLERAVEAYCTKMNAVVKPCIMAPTTFTSCTTLHTSTPKNLPPVLVPLSAPASAAPLPAPLFAPKVSTSPLPPRQPFPLKQASPLLSIQQPTKLEERAKKLDERAAIQKSHFDQLRQQLAALGYLLGHKELASIPEAVETTTTITVPPPVDTLSAIVTTLVLSSPPSLTLPLVATRTAQLVPDSHIVLPPHQPFPLKQASPMLSIQQPTILLQLSSTSQPPDPAPVTVPNPVCVYSTPPLPHTIILPKGLCSWLLHTVGVYWLMHPCVGWLLSFGKLIDTRPWKIWAVF